jgi:enterobacterial common antigen flippase
MLGQLFRTGSVHRATFGAICAGLGAQAALVLSGVVFARVLGPQGRGALALLILIPFVVYQIGSLGLPLASVYYVAQDPHRRAPIVGPLRGFVPIQALVLVIVHAAVIGVVIWPSHPDLHTAALLTLAWTPALLMQDYGLAILQGQRRFFSFNVLRALPALINAMVASVLLIVPWRDVTSVVAMLVAPIAVLGGATLAFALPRSRAASTAVGEPSLRQLIIFGAKGMLGSSYPVETFRLDQLVVGLFLSASDLGLYVVALSFINLPRFISQSIGLVAYSQVAAEKDPSRQRKSIWRFFWATTGITILIAFGLELLLPTLVPAFFGNQFIAAVPVSRVLLVAAVLLSARRILAEVMRGAGNPAAGSIAELASFAALVPAFVVFTHSLHLVGVGVALTISAGVSLAVLVVLDLADRRRPALAPTNLETVLMQEAQGPAIL